MSYVIAQLGARMHYAVPRILHADGQLMPISALEGDHSQHSRLCRALGSDGDLSSSGDISCPSTKDGLRATRWGSTGWSADRSISLLSRIDDMRIFNIIKCAILGAREQIGQTARIERYVGRVRGLLGADREPLIAEW